MTIHCSQCGTRSEVLSQRSRCANCEHDRAEFNEKQNEQLRAERDAALANITELRHSLLIANEALLGDPRLMQKRARAAVQKALETTPEGCQLRVKFAALCEAIEKAQRSDDPMRELNMLAESYRIRQGGAV